MKPMPSPFGGNTGIGGLFGTPGTQPPLATSATQHLQPKPQLGTGGTLNLFGGPPASSNPPPAIGGLGGPLNFGGNPAPIGGFTGGAFGSGTQK